MKRSADGVLSPAPCHNRLHVQWWRHDQRRQEGMRIISISADQKTHVWLPRSPRSGVLTWGPWTT